MEILFLKRNVKQNIFYLLIVVALITFNYLKNYNHKLVHKVHNQLSEEDLNFD